MTASSAASGLSQLPTLSILIPVWNERPTIQALLERVVAADAGVPKQILVADDGSTDGTRDILSSLTLPDVEVIFMSANVGRGGVLKYLWPRAVGDFIVHQDADLEYDPRDYKALLEPLSSDRADVVYGSRFKGSIERMRWLNRLGNLTMTATCRILYGVAVSDLMTCYKMYRSSLIRDLRIDANGFDFEAEFTARLAQRRARFAEVPVSFYGRTFEEGKKIRAFDAVRVMRELVRCRVVAEAGQ
ncbi:MAG: glycosyltransferase family 2 protein [Acidobacteria bacterium]|nr:glycosyltransferase family 2 protein [Acidobacteriota bacterium]